MEAARIPNFVPSACTAGRNKKDWRMREKKGRKEGERRSYEQQETLIWNSIRASSTDGRRMKETNSVSRLRLRYRYHLIMRGGQEADPKAKKHTCRSLMWDGCASFPVSFLHCQRLSASGVWAIQNTPRLRGHKQQTTLTDPTCRILKEC